MDLRVNSPEVADWVRERIPKVAQWTEGAKSIGYFVKEKVIGAVVYDAFTPYECCIHVALEDPRCKHPDVLHIVFAYPFEQLRLKRLTGLVGASNEKGKRLCEWLGFTLEGRKAAALGDDDELIYGMLAGSCKWL